MSYFLKQTKRTLLFSCVLLMSFNLYAVTASQQLSTLFKKVTSLQGNFTQIVYGQGNSQLSSSKGNFKIVRPNHFSWQVTSVPKELIVTDGKTIWMYQADLQQVTISDLTQKINSTPLAILSGSNQALNNNYNVKLSTKNKQTYLLLAKDKSSAFSKVELGFSNHDKLQTMILWDELGQKTQITFTDIQTNKSISKKYFTFQVPKGVDVVH